MHSCRTIILPPGSITLSYVIIGSILTSIALIVFAERYFYNILERVLQGSGRSVPQSNIFRRHKSNVCELMSLVQTFSEPYLFKEYRVRGSSEAGLCQLYLFPARSLWVYSHCCNKGLKDIISEVLFKFCYSLILVLILSSS